MNRKGILSWPWALWVYAFIVVVAFFLALFSIIDVPLTIQTIEHSSAVYTYADSLALHECNGNVTVVDVINAYFSQGITDPTANVYVFKEGLSIGPLSLEQCSLSYFDPYTTYTPQGQTTPLISSYGLLVLSPHCENKVFCFSVGTVNETDAYHDLIFYTPFHDIASMRVYVRA